MTYKLNIRFLVKFLLVTGLVLTALHFWHRRQAGKQVEHLRHLAEVAQKEGRKADEVRYLDRYLAFRPSDVDARERLGRVRYEQARTPTEVLRAFLVLEETLRRDPGRTTLRRFNVDVALDPRLMLVTEAHSHLDKLSTNPPTDGEIEGLLGLCFEAEQKPVEAWGRYAMSIALKPDQVDSYARLAFHTRRATDAAVVNDLKVKKLQAPQDPDVAKLQQAVDGLEPLLRDPNLDLTKVADKVIEALVTNNGKNFRARLTAAVYWRAVGKADLARAQVDAARKLAPDDADVILTDAALKRDEALTLARPSEKEDPEQASKRAAGIQEIRTELRKELDRGLELHPKLQAMHQVRAEVEIDDRNLDQAEVILQKATEALPDSPDLWLSLTDIKVRRNNPAGAEKALERFRELGAPGPVADYQAARILILREDWFEAAQTLNRVRDDLAGTPYVKPANLLLARCYEQMGELDRRIEAFGRVVGATDLNDPLWVEATLGLAEARAALGQTEAALELYQTLTARVPGAWLAIGRIRLGQELQKPKPIRDLSRVREAVDRAEKILPPNTTGLVLLRADLLHLQEDNAGARKLLTDLRQEKPKDVEVWIALAVQDLRDAGRAQAEATLDEAQRDLGDSVALRLARARLLVEANAPDAADRLRALAPADGDSFSKTDRLRLARGLADIAAARGAGDVAGDLLARAAAAAPHNLGVHMTRFDRAMQAGDVGAAEQVLGQIRAVDGTDGTTHRAARARYLLLRAQKDPADAAALDEAERLLEAVEAERPGWGRVALWQAAAAEIRADRAPSDLEKDKARDKAIERYRKAFDQGEQTLVVAERVTALLWDRARFDEADAFLKRLPEEALTTSNVGWLAAGVVLRSAGAEAALEQARKVVKLKDSDDYRKLLWVARLIWEVEGKKSPKERAGEWEEWLRAALARAKGNPAPLVTLVQFLTAAGRKEEAQKVIAGSADTVAPDRRALAVAQCLVAIGEVEEAGKAYEKAAADRPGDATVIRAYAQFLMQTGKFDPKTGAPAQWERLKNLPSATPDDRDQALMMMALSARLHQGSGGDYRKVQEAMAAAGVLEGGVPKAPTDDMPPAKLRSAAVMLSIQLERQAKVQAIRHLERLEAVLLPTGQTPTAADRFLRGQLHASLNEAEPARTQLALAVAAEPKNAVYLAYYVNFLVRQRRSELLPEAEQWLKRLREAQPNEYRTAELTARLAAARNRPAEAKKALAEWEDKPNAPVGRLAAVYEELGLPEDAGRMYQKVAERVKRPEGLLPYAVFLGRQQRTEEALRRCEEARKQNCPPTAVTEAGVLILYAAEAPSSSDINRVMGWIQEALPKAGSQPAVAAALLNRQAAILNLQARYDEAIAVYERLLTVNPRDAVAMNNLGYLLAAHRQQFPAAFGWLERAKAVVGPLPELLDTEALIHLARAKVDPATRKQSLDAALALLGDVEVQAPSGTAYFHLAQARLAAGSDDEAKQAWVEAVKNRKLAVAELHPLERADYEKLRDRFGGA